MSNVLYSSKHDLVYVGCGKTGQGNETHFYNFFALEPTTGEAKWTNQTAASEGGKLMALSEEVDLLYFFRIPTPFEEKRLHVPEATSCRLYISLKDGAVVSQNSEETCEFVWMGFMQTKVGFTGPGLGDLLMVPSHDDNTVTAFNARNATAPPIWSYQLPTSPNVELAFSNNGVIFGSSHPHFMFALSASTGAVLFTTSTNYCDNTSAIISSPSVDSQSVAYISCGNQVIAIDERGSLKWKSKVMSLPYDLDVVVLSPSLNEKTGLLYFVNSRSSITVLSMETGSFVKTISLPTKGTVDPPILVGDKFMYILAVPDPSSGDLAVTSLPQ